MIDFTAKRVLTFDCYGTYLEVRELATLVTLSGAA
jgi:hypothetical protein